MKRLLLAATTALTLTGAFAQNYPTKPVTFVVPFAAGGPTDNVARDLAEAMRKPLGGNVIVENVAGAGGTLGQPRSPRQRPTATPCCSRTWRWPPRPPCTATSSYKTMEDFEYLGMINEVPMTLIGSPRCRPTTSPNCRMDRQNKGKFNLANAGLGSASHLCGLLFQTTLKVDMATVPYKGTAPAMTDLIGGQVDIMCDQTTNTTGQIESRKVKAYAVTTPKRLTTPALKDLPTLDESGLKGFNVTIWHGLYAPKGTPKAVLDKINAALKAALKDPEFIKREEALGAVVVTDTRVNRPNTRSSSRPRSTSGGR